MWFKHGCFRIEEARQFLTRRGLEISPLLASRAFKKAWDGQPPELKYFAEWLKERGVATYEEYLATHPRVLISTLFDDRLRGDPAILGDIGIPTLLNLHVERFYPFSDDIGRRFKPSWFDRLSSTPITFVVYSFVFIVACIRFGNGLLSNQPDPTACLAISTLLGFVVSILADSWDVWRHSLPFILLAQLFLVLFLAEFADFVATRRRSTDK